MSHFVQFVPHFFIKKSGNVSFLGGFLPSILFIVVNARVVSEGDARTTVREMTFGSIGSINTNGVVPTTSVIGSEQRPDVREFTCKYVFDAAKN